MKNSSASSVEDDLLEAFTYCPEEVAALARAGEHRPLTLEDYLDFCSQLPQPSHDQLRDRPAPRGPRFRL
jgi:hypothetical protein